MRKVNFCIAVLFVLLTCQIYAENKVNIRIIQNDLTSTNIEVNENVKHLTFAGPEIRSITSIEGLEKLKSLESLDFYNLTFNNF